MKFRCDRTYPNQDYKTIIPFNDQIYINYTIQDGTIKPDFSAFDDYVKEDETIAKLCISRNKNSIESRFIDQCAMNSKDNFDECISSVMRTLEGLFSQYTSDQRSIRLKYPGEFTPGPFDKKNLKKYCSKANWNEKFLSKSFIANHLSDVLGSVNDQCRKEIVEGINDKLQENFGYADRTKPGYDRLVQGTNVAFDELYKVIRQHYLPGADQEISLFQCKKTVFGKIKSMNKIMESIIEQFSCLPIKEGEKGARLVDLGPTESKSGIEQKYKLTRSGNTYNVGLNLEFSPRGRYDDKLNLMYQQRVNRCLKESNKYLKGPGGKKINIYLYERKKHRGRSPTPVQIFIENNKFRSHSYAWNKNIDCSAIVHELLHLMGLCDEYQETATGYVFDEETRSRKLVDAAAQFPAYDCRSLGPEDSIMSDHVRAFASVKKGVEFITCKRVDTEERVTPEPPCPRGYMHDNKKIFSSKDDPIFLELVKGFDKFPHLFRYVIRESKPSKKSLLSPSHFNTIIFPNCSKKNGNYYSCSRGAYKSSSAVSGIPGTSCPHKPKNCSGGNTGWISGD